MQINRITCLVLFDPGDLTGNVESHFITQCTVLSDFLIFSK